MSDYTIRPNKALESKATQLPKLITALVRDVISLENAKAVGDDDSAHRYRERVSECEEALEKVLSSVLDL